MDCLFLLPQQRLLSSLSNSQFRRYKTLNMYVFLCGVSDSFHLVILKITWALEEFSAGSFISSTSLVAQRLKRLPPMRETRVRTLGREDPLEKEMVTHSSILAWRIPWTEEPSRLQSIGSQRVGHD